MRRVLILTSVLSEYSLDLAIDFVYSAEGCYQSYATTRIVQGGAAMPLIAKLFEQDVMGTAIFLFVSSFLLSLFFVVSKPLHAKFSTDTIVGDQKFHQGAVPRIGGLAILLSLMTGVLFADLPTLATTMFIASLPVAIFGLVEDLFKSVSSLYRLLASFVTSALFIFLSGVIFTSVDIFLFDELFDMLFLWPLLTVIALSALINSINIIDGFNGLASGASMIMASGLAVLANQSGDFAIMQICLCFVAIIFGFFLVNFPKGALFLGDAGAYILGFFLGGCPPSCCTQPRDHASGFAGRFSLSYCGVIVFDLPKICACRASPR